MTTFTVKNHAIFCLTYLENILRNVANYRLRDEIQKEDRDVLHLLHQKYFQNGITTESIDILESLITESVFGTSIPLFALEASKHAQSPIYQYLYSHAGSLCLAEVSNLTFWQILGKVRRMLPITLCSKFFQKVKLKQNQILQEIIFGKISV